MNYGRKGIQQKKKLLNSSTTKLRSIISFTTIKILLILIVAVLVSGSCLFLGSIQGIIASAPDISTINVSPEGFATKIYNSNGDEIQTLSTTGSNRISVDIENVPVDLQHAFVAIEDERFYDHNGIDIKGIFRAAYITITNRNMSEGASTITQQLLKNNVFNAYNESDIQKIKRKVQEQYLAIKLETKMDKAEILENYLNTINLGNGYYGVQAAANGYFGKDVSELTLSECAVIASITQNPSKLNPVKYPERNAERQQKVLRNMLEQEWIDEVAYNDAISDDVYARVESLDIASESTAYSYFVDSLIDEIIEDLMEQKGYTEAQATNIIYKGGLKILSTQDTDMQSIADKHINDPDNYPSNTEFTIDYALSVKNSEGKITNYSSQTLQTWQQTKNNRPNFTLLQTSKERAKNYIDEYKNAMVGENDTVIGEDINYTIQPQVSFSIMDQHTGYVKVLVGGRGEKTGSRTLNRATRSYRQPGSSIKPLVAYGPALDLGAITLATTIDDAPYYYSGSNAKLVKNYTEGDYRGLIDVREAIIISQNVPAVKVLTKITPQVGYNYLEKFGLTTLVSPKNPINGAHDVVQPLALGGMTKGVYNIEMNAAYATIANDGVYTKPVYYTQVYDNAGNLILDNTTPTTHTVLKETTAFLLRDVLEDVVSIGTGKSAQLSNQPVAGKTGTTQYDSDKWFCGFTPYYTGVIWVGYDENDKKVSGINHTGIWGKIMNEIHKDLPTGTYNTPDGIVELQVCEDSGKLPVEGLCDQDPRGNRIDSEYFSEDNMPTESCDVHVKVTICDESEKIASAYCPKTTTKVFIKKASTSAMSGSESGYTTKDAPYAITEEQLTQLCNIHNKYNTKPNNPNNDPIHPSDENESSTAETESSTQATKPSESSSDNNRYRDYIFGN